MTGEAAETTVRLMTIDDLDAVIGIERQSYGYPWTPGIFRDCLRAGYLCCVASVNDRICGYSLMSFGAGESHILNLCVAPQARRSGIASSILDFMLSEAREIRVQNVFLEMRESNAGARQLYEGMGFTRIGVREGYYPDKNGREDAAVYSLRLF